MKRSLISATIIILIAINASGQNSVPRALLPSKTVYELSGEASGERAMNHIIEMAAYIHDRPASCPEGGQAVWCQGEQRVGEMFHET